MGRGADKKAARGLLYGQRAAWPRTQVKGWRRLAALSDAQLAAQLKNCSQLFVDIEVGDLQYAIQREYSFNDLREVYLLRPWMGTNGREKMRAYVALTAGDRFVAIGEVLFEGKWLVRHGDEVTLDGVLAEIGRWQDNFKKNGGDSGGDRFSAEEFYRAVEGMA